MVILLFLVNPSDQATLHHAVSSRGDFHQHSGRFMGLVSSSPAGERWDCDPSAEESEPRCGENVKVVKVNVIENAGDDAFHC